MPNYINFKQDVDNWYRTKSGENNQWARILSAVNKNYAQANYAVEQQAMGAMGVARQQSQSTVTSLYGKYRQSREALGGLGSTFQRQVGAKIDAMTGQSSLSTYRSTLQESMPQVGQYNPQQDEAYKAYTKHAEGTASLIETMFDYFNLDKDNQTTVDYISKEGMLDASGKVTAKGKMMLRYYLNNRDFATEAPEGEDADTWAPDRFFSEHGTLQNYLEKNMSDYDPSYGADLSKILGFNIDDITYTADEKREILGTDITTNDKISTDLKSMPKITINSNYFEQENVSRTDVTAWYKEESEGSATKNYWVLDEETTEKFLKGDAGFVRTALGQTNTGEIDFKGIPVADAIKYGVLSDGDHFTFRGQRFTVVNGKALLTIEANNTKHRKRNTGTW